MPKIPDLKVMIAHLAGLGLIECPEGNPSQKTIAARLGWKGGPPSVHKRLTGEYAVDEASLGGLVAWAELDGAFDYRLFLLPLEEFKARVDAHRQAPADPLGFLAARATSAGMRAHILATSRLGRRPPAPVGGACEFDNEDEVRLEIDVDERRPHLLLLDADEEGSIHGVVPSSYVPDTRVAHPVAVLPTARESFPVYTNVVGQPARRVLYAVLSRPPLILPWGFDRDGDETPAVTPVELAAVVAQLARLPDEDFAVRRLAYTVRA